MTEEFLFTCDECGRKFPAEPAAIVDSGMSASCCERDADPADDSIERISAFELESLTESELAELGLTTESRDRLLSGEDVVTGTMCICTDCQDRLLTEQKAAEFSAE
jgi:hypothetical protein